MKQYKDPLHVSYEKLVVPYSVSGQEEIILSKAFIDKQNAWLNLEDIKETYAFKYIIYEMIIETEDKKLLRSLVQDLTLVEFEIQRLYGFPEDARFHRFWHTPKCQCPRLDNNENFGTGFYTITDGCPLHGGLNE